MKSLIALGSIPVILLILAFFGIHTIPMSVIIPITADNQTQTLKPLLTNTDILAFPINLYQNVDPLKTQINGLELASGGTDYIKIMQFVPHLPQDIKYVTYDYEKGWTPEWTLDQNKSITYFEKLHQTTIQANKKLAIIPVYVYGLNWDWGEVAKHTDVLVVQMQNFQINAQVPDDIKPAKLGITLQQATQKIVSEVKAKSPTTKVYLQFGFEVNKSTKDMVDTISQVKPLGIDGVLIWYDPNQLSLETSVLSQIRFK